MDTMYHQAPAYEMHAQAIGQIDENRAGFENAYESALAFCNLLEQPGFFEQFNENEIKEIRNMIIHLALQGASDEDRQLMEQDIIQFFADDDEEGIFHAEDLFPTLFGYREDSSAPSLDFYSNAQIMSCKSMDGKQAKNLKRIAKKTKKIVQTYKREVIRGVVVDEAVGSIVCLTADTEDPGYEADLKRIARERAARIAHETWDDICKERGITPQLQTEIDYVSKFIYPELKPDSLSTIEDFLSIEQDETRLDEMNTEGHKQIDRWFFNNYSMPVDEEKEEDEEE